VSFSAHLIQNKKAGNKLRFDRVLTNHGNGYDINTGIFTAPVNGTYMFSVSTSTSKDKNAGVFIVREGVDEVWAGATSEGDYWNTGATTAIWDMVQGHTVAVRGSQNSMYAVFTGTLLYTRP
jgi:hypothetical protein